MPERTRRIVEVTNDAIDMVADPTVEVEIQQELGYGGKKFKLYVHVCGVTFIRICKLNKEQIKIDYDTAKLIVNTKKIA